MPARNTYICTLGHKAEYIRKQGEDKPTTCTYYYQGVCGHELEIAWDAEPGDYFGTMGLINRL